MATTVKTIVLEGNKYQLIPLEGAKAPTGVKTINWEGKNYILSPVNVPATVADAPVVNQKPPAPVTTEVRERSPFPLWLIGLLGLLILLGILWLIFRPCTVSSTATTIAPAVGDGIVVDSNCYAKAAELHAPADTIKAICDPVPGTNGVSLRLTSGTKVSIGTITFDAESRVWFLQDFTVPSMANYAFEYKGAERQLFSAPFVVGSELGYGKNGERVPFTICWDVTSEGCLPPVDLFPTK